MCYSETTFRHYSQRYDRLFRFVGKETKRHAYIALDGGGTAFVDIVQIPVWHKDPIAAAMARFDFRSIGGAFLFLAPNE